jgi:hypothetical protein
MKDEPKWREMMDIQKVSGSTSLLVDLKSIDDRPGPFCMSFGFELKSLVKSIEKFGLINLPFVKSTSNGKVRVIAGYRRILAAKHLRLNRIPCRDLCYSGVSEFELFIFNLYDNLATRRFNIVEKGMILSRLASHVSTQEIVRHYMPLLDLPTHESTFLFYVNIEQQLENEIKKCLAKGDLSLQAAKMLLDLDQDARNHIFQLISNLKLNINQQRQIIDCLVDLSHKNNASLSELLKEPTLKEIRSNTGLNTPQKAKAILKFLRTKRFPILVRSEQAFKNKLSRLNLPKGVRISAHQYFEAPHYSLEVLFKNGKELTEKIRFLTRTEGLEGVGNPWERGI